jgi:hypothetical protein
VAWTEITRGQYQRDHLRYASDTTDEEWKVTAPHLPIGPLGAVRGSRNARMTVFCFPQCESVTAGISMRMSNG